ncbi:MAG: DUF5985 family protein [Bradyrhizobium sp.]
MSSVIYGLCTLTAALCAVMLLEAYRAQKYRFLLWSGLCFVGLTVNNLLLMFDMIVFIHLNLSLWRVCAGLISMTILLYGLIWDVE